MYASDVTRPLQLGYAPPVGFWFTTEFVLRTAAWMCGLASALLIVRLLLNCDLLADDVTPGITDCGTGRGEDIVAFLLAAVPTFGIGVGRLILGRFVAVPRPVAAVVVASVAAWIAVFAVLLAWSHL